ncbi:8-oxo-dGTP diphosphatase MutT [Idiomarina xiamenensis]|uniref:8-oxo-dGTP diphosphatase n=1 Tax=Idiomarina xiamenensis 10-D-4 TaxID=740709 RepID=K2KSF8_9GAMM|nr:8-oxo-dGTP diphosphatase MutT [Idiomarina xiamenensis]EKE85324.1 7,8-dihydro-8-oxoguanine-triphosphatase [Idiomarina xiamenensis 10-D-4]
MSKGSQVVHVAVGVIEDEQGRLFISRRASERHQGGKWEFPGGKVEQGESVQQALARELREECNIDVEQCAPLTVVEHRYADKAVRLDVWLVTRYRGQAKQLEGQEWRWVARHELEAYQFPDANIAILDCLRATQ